MGTTWTVEYVQSLAPDAASIKAGHKQSVAAKWSNLGRSDEAVWGEIKGSGKNPYQARIDLTGPAFKCSCPSRKFPCKHGIGLGIVLAEHPGDFVEGAPPDWVRDWLDGRRQRETKKVNKATEASAPKDEETRLKQEAAKAKRVAQREDRVTAGVDQLQQRLYDLMRRGLANQDEGSYRYWDDVAARLVDAQAPGLARMVRALASVPVNDGQRKGVFLEEAASIHLLCQAWQRYDQLDPDQLADVRGIIGFPIAKEELLQQTGVTDRWVVVGCRQYHEEGLGVQRLWLMSVTTGQTAVMISFAAANQPFDLAQPLGATLDAELVFYPGTTNQRALIKSQESADSAVCDIRFGNISDCYAAYASALAKNPWTVRVAAAVAGVIPIQHDGEWIVFEPNGNQLLLDIDDDSAWRLLALSGGGPIRLFGEWSGRALTPLSVLVGDSIRPVTLPEEVKS